MLCLRIESGTPTRIAMYGIFNTLFKDRSALHRIHSMAHRARSLGAYRLNL